MTRTGDLLEDDIDLLQDLNVWSPVAFIILFSMSFITVPVFVQLIELQVFVMKWIASRAKGLIFKYGFIKLIRHLRDTCLGPVNGDYLFITDSLLLLFILFYYPIIICTVVITDIVKLPSVLIQV